jgi:hypothetical protein
VRRAISDHENVVFIDGVDHLDLTLLNGGPQVRVESGAAVAINPMAIEGGIAIHIVRYDYNEGQDRVPMLPTLTIEIRLTGQSRRASVFAPNGTPKVELRQNEAWQTLELRDVPLYCVVALEHERSGA